MHACLLAYKYLLLGRDPDDKQLGVHFSAPSRHVIKVVKYHYVCVYVCVRIYTAVYSSFCLCCMSMLYLYLYVVLDLFNWHTADKYEW